MSRYETHNNDVNDKAYQKFVSPIVQAVLERCHSSHQGLDFGAGTGPVISKVLNDEGYKIKQYDYFFCNEPHLLADKYDYIVCCEVIEHFHNPDKDFQLLRGMINSGGFLFCMSHIYDGSVQFADWYYKNDETHTFIYQKETLFWIQKQYDFSSLEIDKRLIIFKN